MKKHLNRVFLAVSCIFIAALMVMFSSMVYVEKFQIKTIDTQISSDGKYKLLLQQKGEPVWSFGPVEAKIILMENGKIVDKQELTVYNDGTGLTTQNWFVEWSEN